MDDIFHEIEEDIKRDRLVHVWKSYGNYIIGGVLVLLLASAAFILWRDHQNDTRSQESTAYQQAIELQVNGKTDKALEKFEKISADGGVYANFADLQRAGIMVTTALQNKTPVPVEAVAIYKNLSVNPRGDMKVAHLASLFLSLIEAGPDASEETLANLEKEKIGTNPWSNLSTELMAMILYSKGQNEKAAKMMDDLASNRAISADIRQRAEALAKNYRGE
jgi:hypothetical protein